jgi:hypothetical protein
MLAIPIFVSSLCDLKRASRHSVIFVGLARNIYIRCTYGIFGLEITKYTEQRLVSIFHTGLYPFFTQACIHFSQGLVSIFYKGLYPFFTKACILFLQRLASTYHKSLYPYFTKACIHFLQRLFTKAGIRFSRHPFTLPVADHLSSSCTALCAQGPHAQF